MKRFELSKEYPDCPIKKGDIVEQDCYGQYVKQDECIIFGKEDIDKYPDFWKEVVEKEYEVISWVTEYGDVYEDFIRVYGVFVSLGAERYTTKLVRLADDEIFKIGDKTPHGKITGFKEIKGDMVIVFESGVKQKLSTVKHDKTGIKEAIDTLIHELKTDKGYWETWKANIAMAYKDEVNTAKNDLHTTANNAAVRFLQILTRE